MDNADDAGVGYLNNAPIPHLAFILPSVDCSVSVAGSDIGQKGLRHHGRPLKPAPRALR